MIGVLDWQRVLAAYPDIEVVGFHSWLGRGEELTDNHVGSSIVAAVWVQRGAVEVLGATYTDRRHGDLLRMVAAIGGIPVRSYEVSAQAEPAVVGTLVRLARQGYTPAPLRQRRSLAWQAKWGRDIDHIALANTAREYLLIQRAITGAGWPTGQDIANVLDPAPARPASPTS